jgi:hypothetical protein
VKASHWLVVAALLMGGVDVAGAGAARHREPAVAPVPYLAVDLAQPGLHLQLNFPPGANAGADRRVYWLSGAESLSIDLQMGVGPGDIPLPDEVTGALVIDGLQVAVEVDAGAPTRTLTRTLVAGVVDHFHIRVPGNRVAAGAHWANLVFWRRDGRPFPSLTFAIIKDGAAYLAPRPTAGFTRVRPTGNATCAVLKTPSQQPLVADRSQGGDGRLSLQLVSERDDADGLGETIGISFLAFVDGVQVSLGRLGRSPHLRLRRRERAVADFALSLAPHARGAHTVVVFAVVSSFAPSEQDGSGGLAPRCIGWSVLSRG